MKLPRSTFRIPTSALALASVLLAGSIAAEPFRGDNCAACHTKIRDAKPELAANAADGGSYDAIVIGGGLSGLTAAHFLRDSNVLVLEKEDKVGGKVRREMTHAGLTPVAAVYTNKPYGAIQTLMDDLDLHFSSITTQNSLFVSTSEFVADWLTAGVERLPYSDDVKAKLVKLRGEMKNLADTQALAIPVENSKNGPLRLYDRVSFAKYLEDLYGPEVARIGDLYSRDVFGITATEVSAFAGLMYLEGELEATYSGIGGLGEATEALAKELKDKLRTGSFVWSVSQNVDGVTVNYDRAGKPYTAKAKFLVFAVPSMIVKKIATDLTTPKKRALNAVRYSAYAVVPMALSQPVSTTTFVLWNSNAFFTDLTFPTPTPGKEGQVVVAYVPYGGEPGRNRMLSTADAVIKSHVLADFEKMFPGAGANVKDVSVIRWGHAMPVIAPDYMVKVRPIVARPEGRYYFAGVDTQVPAYEGAIYAGYLAAQKVRKALGLPEQPAAPAPTETQK